MLINDEIIARSKGYIQKYNLIGESNDGNLYKVAVEVHVASGKLQDNLAAIGLLMARKHKPRIMVIIPE